MFTFGKKNGCCLGNVMYLFLSIVTLFILITSVGADEGPKSEEGGANVIESDGWYKVLLSREGEYPDRIYSKVLAERNEMCLVLERNVRISRFLSEERRAQACRMQCKVFEYACAENKLEGFVEISKYGDVIMNYVERTFDDEEFEEDDLLFDDDTIRTWFLIAAYNGPILFSLIPVLLNQYKRYDWSMAVACTLCSGCLMFVVGTQLQAAYNIGVSLICIVSPSGSSAVIEAAIPLVWMVMMMMSFLIFDEIFQLALAVVGLLFFVYYLNVSFIRRRSGSSPGTLVLVLQVLLLHEQIEYARSRLFLRSFGLNVFEMVLNSIFPNGVSGWLIRSDFRLAQVAARQLELGKLEYVKFIVGAVGAQVVMFIAFRTLFGGFSISSLRYKFDVESLFSGFVAYSSDIFGGFYLIKVALNLERNNVRRFWYSVVNVLLLVYEVRHAREYVIFRIIAFIVDGMIYNSRYSRMPRYLSSSVDLSRVAYPMIGSNPWVALNALVNIGENSVIVRVAKNGSVKRGVGLVRRVGGALKLLTVGHVYDPGSELRAGNFSVFNPKVHKLTKTGDPCIAIDLTGARSVMHGGVEAEGCDIVILSKQEIPSVSMLYCVVPNGQGDDASPMISPIDDWSINERDGELMASVNLKKGDSGGPVVAVLRSGDMRYCGCVSRGGASKLHGNHISFIYSEYIDHDLDSDGSDDEDKPVAAKVFNAMREDYEVRVDLMNSLAKKVKDTGVWIGDIDGGWKYYRDGFHEVDSEGEVDVGTDDEGDKVKKHVRKKQAKRDKRFAYNKELQRRCDDIHGFAVPLFGDEGADVLIKTLRKLAFKVDINPDSKYRFEDGFMLVDDNPI